MFNFLINDTHFLKTFTSLLQRSKLLKVASMPDQWKEAFQVLFCERSFLIGLVSELVKKLITVTQQAVRNLNESNVKLVAPPPPEKPQVKKALYINNNLPKY